MSKRKVAFYISRNPDQQVIADYKAEGFQVSAMYPESDNDDMINMTLLDDLVSDLDLVFLGDRDTIWDATKHAVAWHARAVPVGAY